MIYAVLLFLVGLFLSAFFSGAETGFYRVSRLRLVLDGLGGDWIARGLLWLTNHPSLFIATALVGNNLANYLTSMAIVLGTQTLFTAHGQWPQLLAPVVLAPLVFVYGELLPKHVYYQAPNRMLRRSGLPLLVCTAIFLPVSGVLWSISQLLKWVVGESPQKMRLTLALRELEQAFHEGREEGVLRAAQGGIAQGFFAVANRSVLDFVTTSGRVPRVRLDMKKGEIIRLARRHRVAAVPVEDPKQQHKMIGYLRVVDLYLDESERLPPLRRLIDVSDEDTYIAALMKMQSSGETLGRVTSADGRTVGFVTARQLGRPILRA